MSTQNPTTIMVQDAAEQAVVGFQQKGAREQLAGWVMEHVSEWEEWRKQHLDTHWAEFLRKYRGIYDEADRTRQSERSRLISPALQQAVEEAVSEIEEAIFGDKEAWFDVDDDRSDGNPEDWQSVRLRALDDMDYVNVEGALLETGGLMNAIYGTAIGKIVVDTRDERSLASYVDDEEGQVVHGVAEADRVVVFLEPVRPDQFVIDTSVNKPGKEGIDMALGMAHRLPRPRHSLRAKMDAGKYWEVPLDSTTANEQGLATESGGLKTSDSEDANLITEYHGLVPRSMLDAAIEDKGAVDEIDSRDMVESICTIVDDRYILAARKNDNLKQDRDFVAAPFDIVPGSFWGRGVCEKGINAQKALDALLRAQIDNLGYRVHGMMGVNLQRRDPRQKLEVKPAGVLYSNGDPRETFFPIQFGGADSGSFAMTGELERLVTAATGTAGTGAPLRSARSNSTLGGMSMIAGGLAKRYKRTLRLLERHLLMPFVEKFIQRHMQWNSENYPFVDLRFNVRTSMSLQAREAENQTLTSMLQVIPPQSPVFYAMVGQIVQNSSAKDKGVVLQLIEAVVKGQAPGSAEDKNQGEDPERSQLEKEEIAARTENKKAKTAETYQKMVSGGAK